MRINHNIAALNTYSRLSAANNAQSKSLEKLSSGMRINRAGDDAAGLAISEKMRSQIRGLDQASRNSQDGISMIQTAEGALSETHSILQRMRELAVQASNDTNTDQDRNEIQNEINQLSSEINRIAGTTEFNKQTLLDGGQAAGNVKGATAAITKAGNDGIQAQFEYTFNCVIASGCDMSVCGVSFYAAACDSIDCTSLTGSVSQLANRINERTTTWEAEAIGNKLILKQKTGSFSQACGLCTGTGCAFHACMVSVTVDEGKGSCAQEQRLTFTDDAIKEGVKITIGNCSLGLWNSNEGTYSCVGEAAIAMGVDCIYDIACVDGEVICAIDFVSCAAGLVGCATGNFICDGQYICAICVIDDTTLKITSREGSTYASETLATITAASGTSASEGNGIQLQIGANAGQTFTATFGDMTGQGLNVTGMAANQTLQASDGTIAYFRSDIEVENNGVSNEYALDVTTADKAAGAISALDDAIATVSAQRSKLGAYQNRLEHTISNLDTSSENLTAAESRIRDVDMAKEMMEFTKNNILNQAATAMLAQANQQPQGVLQLLG